jgi:hypothetical protein
MYNFISVEIASSSTSAVVIEQEEYFTEPPPRQPSRVLKPFDITPYRRYERYSILTAGCYTTLECYEIENGRLSVVKLCVELNFARLQNDRAMASVSKG